MSTTEKTEAKCWCGAVRLELRGEPAVQFYCHCDDCQTVHGAAYVGVALYPADAVQVTQGERTRATYKTLPRERCARCGTQMLGHVQGQPLIGVKGNLLPAGKFKPAFHIRCKYALLPVVDALPHYDDLPREFGGDGRLSSW